MFELKRPTALYRRSLSEIPQTQNHLDDDVVLTPTFLDLEEKVQTICCSPNKCFKMRPEDLSCSTSSDLSDISIDLGQTTSASDSIDLAESRMSLNPCDLMESRGSCGSRRSRRSKPAPWRKLVEYANTHQKDPSQYTTVILRNIPTKYTIEWIIEEIHATGNRCDFVHLPVAQKFEINLGYAFINFFTHAEAKNFIEVFEGHQFMRQPRSLKRASVDYASLQGFEQNVEFYSGRRIAKSKRAPWVLRERLQ
jgi:hypothetical protein